MSVLKRITVVLGFLSVLGVLLWAALFITIFYTPDKNAHWMHVPGYYNDDYPLVSVQYALYERGGDTLLTVAGLLSYWMLGGAIGVLIFGFYFAFTAKTRVQRVLMALCFLCVWVGVVVCYIPGLIEWFLD